MLIFLILLPWIIFFFSFIFIKFFEKIENKKENKMEKKKRETLYKSACAGAPKGPNGKDGNEK